MITTGGTGGHIFPGLAVAAKLGARGWRVFWLGTREGMEAKLVPQHGVSFEGVSFGGVRGKGLRQFVLGPFALAGACWQSRGIIRRRAIKLPPFWNARAAGGIQDGDDVFLYDSFFYFLQDF